MSYRTVADAVGVDKNAVKNAVSKDIASNNNAEDKCPGAEFIDAVELSMAL